MEDFQKFIDIDFATSYNGFDLSEVIMNLQDYINKLNECFDNEQNNFVNICYYVFRLKVLFDNYTIFRNFIVETKKAKYTFDSIMTGFGLDKTQVCRILKVYEKFIEIAEGKPRLKIFVAEFSKSKLFELLAVDSVTLKKDIERKFLLPSFSVKDIRIYVKNYLSYGKTAVADVVVNKNLQLPQSVEEDIPQAYDPHKHYDFTYFEKQSKSQLLNIVWELQKEYEKLKDKSKNSKNK